MKLARLLFSLTLRFRRLNNCIWHAKYSLMCVEYGRGDDHGW